MKTIAKRARVGPRAQVLMTIAKLFLKILSSTSCRGSDIIVLDNVLKLRLELIKSRNDDATEKIYRLPWFLKVVIFG